jgi:sugar O-acyltransferase (sialic acid O-acetyltransferase NeuD family)
MVVLGAGGHASEILDVLSSAYSSTELFLFDDTGAKTIISSRRYSRLLRSATELAKHFHQNPAFCIAVGKPDLRHKLMVMALELGGQPANAVATTAYVSAVAELGVGLNVMHMGYVSPGVTIADGVLLNAGVLIHHDVIIGRYAEISPGAALLGGVRVGPFARIGARAVILPGISVGENAVVGAGAVVISDVMPGAVVVGVPAKPKSI